MNRIKSFEYMRIIMIIIIVISHLEFLGDYWGGEIYSQYFHNPTFAVDYFFILSGFGLMYSYTEFEQKTTLKGSLCYALKKIKKIYPLYIISLIVSLPLTIYNNYYEYGSTLFMSFVKAGAYLVLDLTLLQSITGMIQFSHSINGVSWFISTLFILYLFTPLLISFLNKICKTTKRCIISLIITLMALLLVYQALKIVDEKTFFDDLSYGSPFFRIFFLIAGMIVAKLAVVSKNENKRDLTIYEGLICFLCLVWFVFRNTFNKIAIITRFIDVFLCIGFVLIFAFNSGKISSLMNNSILSNLSGYAMYIYLLHYPVRMTLIKFLDVKGFYIGDFTGIVEAILCFVLSIILAVLVKTLLEYINKRGLFSLKK